ncbi:Abi family protein [Lutimonas vermicola]|uniref:Abi family protein n=1 Tax=Lutimonas vermicola TaxID=414288 RepID=A0ABU9L653_9FLAO
MANKATSIDNQIIKLRNRGMILDFEEAKLKEILLDIGYYRLGFYWHPFEVDEDHNFQKNTRFSNILNLYYLDVDLRYLLIKYINRFELNFRTNLIYWPSMKYENNCFWYTDPKIMSKEYIRNLKRYYNFNFINKNFQIKRHHENYPDHKYAPCWKTFEYYTFGSISRIYESILDEELKKEISSKYQIKKFQKFQNFLDTLVFVRNSCAHSGVIYDLNIVFGVNELPNIKFNNGNSHQLDAAIKVLLFLLDEISLNRKNELQDSLNNLFSKHAENEQIKDVITKKIGYSFPS